MSHGSYTFAAIKGQQGKHEYYLVQCPIRLIPRIFLFDEIEVPASLRRIHTVDSMRITDIANHVAENIDSYIITPIVATIDREVIFESSKDINNVIGRIHIPLAARMIIQDGQHRRLAIQKIISKNAMLDDDTIPVMLIPDEDFIRSQRLYSILNDTQTKGSRSKRVLHEKSDLAALAQQLIEEIPLFQGRIELEKTTISNRSTAIFTLSAVYQANEALLDVHKGDEITLEDVQNAHDFWLALGENIQEWQQIIHHEMTTSYLREHYVHGHTVMLIALGKAAHELIKHFPDDWRMKLKLLKQIDWSRSNTNLWEGRAMVLGKMSKATNSIKLSASAIKQVLGLSLSEEEQQLEQLLGSKQAS